MFESSNRLVEVFPGCAVEHHRYHGVNLLLTRVQPRDFCVMMGAFRLGRDHSLQFVQHDPCSVIDGDDGSTLILAVFSIQLDQCPPVAGYIRGEIGCGGFVIEPVPDQPWASRVTFIGQCDVKGSLPDWIKREIGIRQPMLISAIRAEVTSCQPRMSAQSQVSTLSTVAARRPSQIVT